MASFSRPVVKRFPSGAGFDASACKKTVETAIEPGALVWLCDFPPGQARSGSRGTIESSRTLARSMMGQSQSVARRFLCSPRFWK
jgi:hypothetical protein